MSDFLSINGSLNQSTFLKLKKNKGIKDLEIVYGTINDDWHLISDLKNLKTISIKDSFIDFQNFYKALGNLKKLEKITYNYYCYFNKKPKEKLINIKITNKIFQIDFPDHKDPDFDFNYFLKETYKNKNNSIFEIQNSEKIFINLEKIIFNNYINFDNLINSFDEVDKKKFNKMLYWETSPSKLTKFKKLKNINIDQNNKFLSFIPRINHFIKDKKIINSQVKINNIDYKNIESLFDDVNILDFNDNSSNAEFSSYHPGNLEKYKNYLENKNDNLCASINSYHLYKTAVRSNTWKLKNKNKVSKIFNHKIETIIFSNINALFSGFYDAAAGKEKIKLFKKLFDNLNNLKKIIIDFSKIEKSDIIGLNINFLISLIYEITKNNKNIEIIFFKSDPVILENLNWPKNHLIYIIRSVNKLKEQNQIKINFFNLKNDQINYFFEKFIFSKIKYLLVVDNLIFNSSDKFKELDIFYADYDFRDSLFEFEFENRDSLDKKYQFGQLYWDTYESLYTRYYIRFDNLDNELSLVVKKDYAKYLSTKNSNIENILYLHHPPIQTISEILDKEIKINKSSIKKFDQLKNKEEFLLDRSLSFINQIKNSNQFNFKNNQSAFSDSLKKPDNFDKEFGLFKNFNKLKRFKLQGDSPFYGKYILLDKLENLVSLENLEDLEIDGLIDQRKISFPYFPKLKKIELKFSYNAYNVILGKGEDGNTKIENFSNLPNIESLELRSLYSDYSPTLIKKVGIDRFSEPQRWHNIEVNFSDIHELKKLKELKIFLVKSKDLNKIKELPSIESLQLFTFQITEELNPDEGQSAYCPIINEKTFSFLKNSKSLKKIKLSIGHVASMEDLWGSFLSTRYSGNADFLNYISYNIEELDLTINVEIDKQYLIQDIINNICNRFLKLKKLTLEFGVVINNKTFDWESLTYKKKILDQTIDIKKFLKLKNLETLNTYMWSSAIKFKTINFKEIFNLKKLRDLRWNFENISFEDFKNARINFKNEKFENRKDYDPDYEYYSQEDSNYSKNWSRFEFINSDNYGDEWLTLEDRFLELQKEENEKRTKKETIVKKKKN